MAANKVVRSIEAPGGDQCVDIFVRPDGSWGFEAYRRDVEDGRGWFPTGHFAGREFDTRAEAERAASLAVPWLKA